VIRAKIYIKTGDVTKLWNQRSSANAGIDNYGHSQKFYMDVGFQCLI